jgi:23S rRNA (adenine2503-C2)-methyltransferase
MLDFNVHHSAEDDSVNFVAGVGFAAFEARYVRRSDDYFIAYLSSHTGCDRACRFCHLTAMGETSMAWAGMPDFMAQAHRVLSHYILEVDTPADRVHFNFMARARAPGQSDHPGFLANSILQAP